MSLKIKKNLKQILRQVLMITFAILIASLFLGVSGFDAGSIINGLIRGFTEDLGGTVRWATPLILSGIAICVTYKAEVFNLGVDGQIILGAIASTAVAFKLPEDLPSAIFVPTLIIVGMIAGALYALIPAILKIKTGTNEVVSTLLLNFVAALFLEYVVNGPLTDTTTSVALNASAPIPQNAWLPRLQSFAPSTANVGLFIAIFIVAVISFVFFKTTFGHKIKIVGANIKLAEYSGINANKNIMGVMAISGAIAGLIGSIEILGIQRRLLVGFNPDFGFEGIVVSLLANNNPIGVLFSGFFFGALKNGGINMERVSDVPSAVTDIVMALIILIVAAQITIPFIKKIWKKNSASCAIEE